MRGKDSSDALIGLQCVNRQLGLCIFQSLERVKVIVLLLLVEQSMYTRFQY